MFFELQEPEGLSELQHKQIKRSHWKWSKQRNTLSTEHHELHDFGMIWNLSDAQRHGHHWCLTDEYICDVGRRVKNISYLSCRRLNITESLI